MTFDPAAAGWKQRHGQGPFTQIVGPVWVRREDDGSSTYGLLAEERHTNSRGVVHGGMLMTFADHMLGWLVWDAVERRPCATISLNNQFIGAVKPGDWMEMRGRIVRQTRSIIFVQGEAKVGERVVLASEGIWKVLGVD
ncbi:PaaI family thioesterase [Ferrovibrio sp.]|jgi:acyl-coenzyme A thioesterase PaaI-like protein|uniref:PaaI family thioesterase n=1 Tax=Ferrovibrio sp. TaxID=1917215 RepID=UPI0035AF0AB8